MSVNIFTIAYQISGDIQFLHRTVYALCQSGKRSEAYELYQELQKQSTDPVGPFIIYVGDVHDDTDLAAVSELIHQYRHQGTWEPSSILATLTEKSAQYILMEMDRESNTISALNNVSMDN
jgi:molybdopterin synthase catalytic subunit